jgi:hypothetical protein
MVWYAGEVSRTPAAMSFWCRLAAPNASQMQTKQTIQEMSFEYFTGGSLQVGGAWVVVR